MLDKERTQLQIVFDNAVVNDSDPSALRKMRMGIAVAGLAMGSPTGVSDAHGEGVQFFLITGIHHFAQLLYPAPCLIDADAFPTRKRDPGGIIAPVFKLFQRIKQYSRCRFVSDIANYTAHTVNLR